MVTYTLTASGQRIASGALALIITQAAHKAAQGTTAIVTNDKGRSARIAADTQRITCELDAPTELFPTYNPTETPQWLTRARQLLDDHHTTSAA